MTIMRKTTILIYIRGYLPGKKYGGPVTSIYNFAELLGDVYNLFLVCLNHDLGEREPYPRIHKGWNQSGKVKVLYLRESQIKRSILRGIVKQIQPRLIYASSIMDIRFNFPMVYVARESGIPVLLAPRGELCTWAINFKQWIKKPYLAFMKSMKFFERFFFQSTMSEEKENIIKYLGIRKEQVFDVSNIPMLPLKRDNYYKTKGEVKVLFISRIHRKKNLLYAVRAVKNVKSPVIFDIYGPIEDKTYWKEVVNETRDLPKHICIAYKGELDPKEAKRIYQQYDCMLFPTLSENYGHVIAEAIANNLPVIISKGTTPWDDLDGKAGYVIPLWDRSEYTRVLNEFSEMDSDNYRVFINGVFSYAQRRLNIAEIKRQYIDMIERIIQVYEGYLFIA